MPYNLQHPTQACTVCGSEANVHYKEFGVGEIVDCARCGSERGKLRYPKNAGTADPAHAFQRVF